MLAYTQGYWNLNLRKLRRPIHNSLKVTFFFWPFGGKQMLLEVGFLPSSTGAWLIVISSVIFLATY